MSFGAAVGWHKATDICIQSADWYLQYYYCGQEWEDIRRKLRQLGIGRDDPIPD